MKRFLLIGLIAIGCGGSGDPFAGHWSGSYETQFDKTNIGSIRAVLSGGSGVVTIDGLDYPVMTANGEVSGKLIGRFQIEGVRLGFRLSDGGRVVYGFMER